MGMKIFSAALALVLPAVSAEVYFKEQFNDDGWTDRWTVSSDWKDKSELGDWEDTTGDWYGGDADDKGIKTSEDARFYGLSAAMSKAFNSSEKKDLGLTNIATNGLTNIKSRAVQRAFSTMARLLERFQRLMANHFVPPSITRRHRIQKTITAAMHGQRTAM